MVCANAVEFNQAGRSAHTTTTGSSVRSACSEYDRAVQQVSNEKRVASCATVNCTDYWMLLFFHFRHSDSSNFIVKSLWCAIQRKLRFVLRALEH